MAAAKKFVTFVEELITDTWLIPCKGRSMRKYSSRRVRQFDKITMSEEITMSDSGDGAAAAWKILTNDENNSELISLCTDDGDLSFRLTNAFSHLCTDWNTSTMDITEGLALLQGSYDAESSPPESDNDIKRRGIELALSELYQNQK